jgi:hypothetical protein
MVAAALALAALAAAGTEAAALEAAGTEEEAVAAVAWAEGGQEAGKEAACVVVGRWPMSASTIGHHVRTSTLATNNHVPD